MEEDFLMRSSTIILILAFLSYQILQTNSMSPTYSNQQDHLKTLQKLTQHTIAGPNSQLKIYETELDYGFQPTSIIVLEGVIEPKTSIKFKELSVKNDKGIEFKLDSALNNVMFGSELKNHKPQGTKTRPAVVTIQSQSKGLEVCLDSHPCRVADYGHGSINKIEISNIALTNVSYYTEVPNNPLIGQYEMKCSKSACDIEKMKKKGKAFIFTRKLPTYKKRAHINLEESYKDIAFHMDIRQDQKEVVFNTRSKNKWEKHEERLNTFFFVKGNAYTIMFNIQTYGITVSVNGMFYHYYKHRMDPERVKKLWFSWDQEGGNYSFIGIDELGSSKRISLDHINVQPMPTTAAPFVEDFEYINDQPVEDFGSDRLMMATSDRLMMAPTPEPELIKIELPTPNKDILSYKTDLICGFPEGSNVNFRGIVRNNSSILLLPIGENFEIMFTFNLNLNRVEMYTRDAREETQEKQTIRLKQEREMDFSFISQQDKIEVCADEQCVAFTLLSEINHVEFTNLPMSDISYYAKPKIKPEPVHHSMNCSHEGCDVNNLQKHGSVFAFVVKLPVDETWCKVDFRVTEKLVPLHMSVGTVDRRTVFEAMDPDWDFSKEEINTMPLSNGLTHLFKFYIQPFGTLTSVDGFYFHFFRHKIEPDDITDIQYEWELVDASYHNDGCYQKPPDTSDDYISTELDEDY